MVCLLRGLKIVLCLVLCREIFWFQYPVNSSYTATELDYSSAILVSSNTWSFSLLQIAVLPSFYLFFSSEFLWTYLFLCFCLAFHFFYLQVINAIFCITEIMVASLACLYLHLSIEYINIKRKYVLLKTVIERHRNQWLTCSIDGEVVIDLIFLPLLLSFI